MEFKKAIKKLSYYCQSHGCYNCTFNVSPEKGTIKCLFDNTPYSWDMRYKKCLKQRKGKNETQN